MTFFRHHIHVRWRLNHVKKNPNLSKLMYFCCYFFWTFNLSYSSTLWLFYTISLSICAHTSCSEWPGMWVAVDGNSCRFVKQSSLQFFLNWFILFNSQLCTSICYWTFWLGFCTFCSHSQVCHAPTAWQYTRHWGTESWAFCKSRKWSEQKCF